MKKVFLFYFSDNRLICFLLGLGLTVTIYAMLFYVLGVISIAIGYLVAVILLYPVNNSCLLKIPLADDTECSRGNFLIAMVFVVFMLAFMIFPFIMEMYLWGKDSFYIWVFGGAMLYFASVFYLCLHKVQNKKKNGQSLDL